MCALIPAAGRGVRFGAAENKVFTCLLGRPLLGWTLSAFAECAAIDAIVLVGTEGELDRLKEIGKMFGGGKLHAVVSGGSTRQESVRLGLSALPETCEWVVIHDAARCTISPSVIDQVVESALFWGAATASLPVADTQVYEKPEGVTGFPTVGTLVDRDGLHLIQTPQVFAPDKLRNAHAQAATDNLGATDDASLYSRYIAPVALAEGSPENLKITTQKDTTLAEAILESRMQQEFRVGHGYDVHRLQAGRPMWLGGVHFTESPFGLEGHSDADAPLHALCDALLGAAGLPDIGQLFPPSDMAHKNRASIEFVQEVRARLEADGWSVTNVDLTIIAEAPKIGPRTAQMKVAIADALHIQPVQVSIKATTNEGMGFVGRSEGIAAHASALISRRGTLK